mmetsp:Transcript_15565/g.37608  ORF Transcript_15565/g.37608 Transcript_15565/m.37608 type:complete len:305 (+) Transcript_15565:297-1211(+)
MFFDGAVELPPRLPLTSSALSRIRLATSFSISWRSTRKSHPTESAVALLSRDRCILNATRITATKIAISPMNLRGGTFWIRAISSRACSLLRAPEKGTAGDSTPDAGTPPPASSACSSFTWACMSSRSCSNAIRSFLRAISCIRCWWITLSVADAWSSERSAGPMFNRTCRSAEAAAAAAVGSRCVDTGERGGAGSSVSRENAADGGALMSSRSTGFARRGAGNSLSSKPPLCGEGAEPSCERALSSSTRAFHASSSICACVFSPLISKVSSNEFKAALCVAPSLVSIFLNVSPTRPNTLSISS